MAPTPEGFSDYGFSDYGEYILFLNKIRNGRKGTINLPCGVNFSGHDSSYYPVPTWSSTEVKKHFQQQDGRKDEGVEYGGLEHAAIIT